MSEWIEPVTEDHLREIGRVIVEWSRAEIIIMDALWEIATGRSFDEAGPDVHISLTSLGILKAVFHARHPEAAGVSRQACRSVNKVVKKKKHCGAREMA